MKKILQTLRLLAILALGGAGLSLSFAADSLAVFDNERSWDLGFTGEVSFYGSDYRERGSVEPNDDLDAGGNVSLEAALEWETGSFMHELDVAASAEMTTEQDSSKWTFTPSLDYTLMMSTFILDINVDFNFSSDKEFLLGYMLWAQKKIWKKDDYSLNISGWAYYRDDGRLLSNAEINLRKFVKQGLGGKISLGVKLDRDTLVTRIGPAAKLNLSYKFPHGIALDMNESIFYGLVESTVYEGCENMDELKFFGDVQTSWKWKWMTLYLTLRSIYRHYYCIPAEYSSAFAENGIYHSAKVGVKISF